VILGAGAVGGTIGGRLADAGYDVVLLARGEHADVMRRDGLRLATPERVIEVDVPVVERPQDLLLLDGDVLILTTKTQQTTVCPGETCRSCARRTASPTSGSHCAGSRTSTRWS
jgi:ketopantoate reductase